MHDLAIIIGAMKCGTTSLFHYLTQHPRICPSSIKEPAFFIEDRTWDRGLDWYRSLYDWDPHRHRWALEASTSYTKRPEVAGVPDRIASVPGDKRFIYIMRDPLERIRSHIEYGRAKEWEPFREAGGGVPETAIEISRYAYQLEPFVREFGRDRILLLTLEEMAETPGEILDRTCDFLGIERRTFEVPDRVHNKSSQMMVRPDWYTEIRHHPVVATTRRLIPFKRWIGRHVLGFEPPSAPQLTESEERWIEEELRDEVAILRDEYGVDVSRWSLSP